MKTGKNLKILLVLVPHRDTRLPIQEWSKPLYTAEGSLGCFPCAAPLAELNRPLSKEELKLIARALRLHVTGKEGKFTTGLISAAPLSENIYILGPALQPELPNGFLASIYEAIKRQISPLVIGTTLLPNSSLPTFSFSEISFRAAALANMVLYEIEDNYYEWKIGPLHWLPKNL